MRSNSIFVAAFAMTLLSFAACSHDDSKPAAAAAATPTPTPAASATNGATDFGAVDGKAGGACKPEVLSDFKIASDICGGTLTESNISNCENAMNVFAGKHPNVDCSSTLADGTVVTIKTSSKSSSSSSIGGLKSMNGTCDERNTDMIDIQADAQSTLEMATSAAFGGRFVPSSDALKAELNNFDSRYAGLTNCGGKPNDEFDAEIQRYIEEIDELQ